MLLIELNKDLREEIIECLGQSIIDIILISNKHSDLKNDVDYVLIVKDSSNKLEIVKIYSKLAVDLSMKYGVFISIYPIYNEGFIRAESMFISNVKDNGTSIY